MTIKELVTELEAMGLPNAKVRIVTGERNNLTQVADIEWVQEWHSDVWGVEVWLNHDGKKE